jgi:hypothetical protein
MLTRKKASGLWVPASAFPSRASNSADIPRADDSDTPARGLVFGLLSSLAIWATVAVAALTVFS